VLTWRQPNAVILRFDAIASVFRKLPELPQVQCLDAMPVVNTINATHSDQPSILAREQKATLSHRLSSASKPAAYSLVDAPRGLDYSAINDPVWACDHRADTEGGWR
jgi:hypothetical protein